VKIHPSAIVDTGAELAEDVEVQAYTIIGPNVQIGRGTIIGPHCVIAGRTAIGENNRFYSGAQVGVESQDLKHNRRVEGRLIMGEANVVREHATISASTIAKADEASGATRIGNHCLLMTCAHVGHDCVVEDHVILANCAALAGHVWVEQRAILGGLSAAHQFCRIGCFAMIGGTTRVWHDAPPYMITDGNPARCRGLNVVGLRRNGFDAASRGRIKAIYRIMFRSGLNTTQALQRIEAEIEDTPERRHFVEFVRASARGITK
jgi:UDP-N-acetylglucosamine acyltransferase